MFATILIAATLGFIAGFCTCIVLALCVAAKTSEKEIDKELEKYDTKV